MTNLENKKISISLLIFSSLHIFFSYVNRTPNDWYEWKDSGEPKYIDQPFSSYNTNFLIFPASLDFTILILTIVLGFSIYYFIFKKDEELKSLFKAFKNKILNFLYKIKSFFVSSLKLVDFKFMAKALVIIFIVLALLGLGISYYNRLLLETTEGIPHSTGESLFMGFISSLKIIIPITILFGILKIIISKKNRDS